MTRVAALYDIHGNLPALEAVLRDVGDVGVDQIVVGGDVVPGPMPRETIARLLGLDLPVRFIYGNGEVAVLAEMAGRTPRVPEQYRDVISWNARRLAADDERRLASWPATLRIVLPDLGDVLFCHATPRNEDEIFTRLSPEQRLEAMFAGVNASVVVCGHTHMQFERMFRSIRIVNAGSVGMPFGPPGADWLLLGPGVQFRHTSYDLAKAAATICETTYPRARDFAAQYVLNPPPSERMLQVFAKAESES